MSVAHSAHFATPPYPLPSGEGMGEGISATSEGIGEGFTSSGQPVGPQREPIGERLASISDRLAVVAVAAHIMERRAPRDCYARSIARETRALALAVRELHREAQAGAPMRAPRIVDASPDVSPSPSLDTTPAIPASPSSTPTASPIEPTAPTAPTARRSTRPPRTPRQTPPQARHRAARAQASECSAQPHARRQGSLGASGAEGGM